MIRILKALLGLLLSPFIPFDGASDQDAGASGDGYGES